MKTFFKLPAIALLLVLVLQSCTKEPSVLDKAAAEITAYTKATEVSVVTKKVVDNNNDNTGTYIITISGCPDVDESKASGSLVTSICAKKLFDLLPADEQKKSRVIEASIKSNGKTGRYYYFFKDMAAVDGFLNNAKTALEKIKAKKYDEAYALYDQETIDREMFDKYVVAPLEQQHSDVFFGGGAVETTGFRYADFKGKNVIIVYNRIIFKDKEITFKTSYFKRKKPAIAAIAFM